MRFLLLALIVFTTLLTNSCGNKPLTAHDPNATDSSQFPGNYNNPPAQPNTVPTPPPINPSPTITPSPTVTPSPTPGTIIIVFPPPVSGTIGCALSVSNITYESATATLTLFGRLYAATVDGKQVTLPNSPNNTVSVPLSFSSAGLKSATAIVYGEYGATSTCQTNYQAPDIETYRMNEVPPGTNTSYPLDNIKLANYRYVLMLNKSDGKAYYNVISLTDPAINWKGWTQLPGQLGYRSSHPLKVGPSGNSIIVKAASDFDQTCYKNTGACSGLICTWGEWLTTDGCYWN